MWKRACLPNRFLPIEESFFPVGRGFPLTLFEDSIDKLGQTAKTIRAQIRDYQTTASDEHASLSVNVLEGLQQLWATVLELKETAQQVEEERRNSQALVEIGQVVNSSLDLATVLNEVMDTLIQLTGAERAFLMQRDESGEMQIEVARNWDRTTVQPVEYAFSSTVVEQVLDSGDAVITTNAQADPRFSDQESVVAYHLRSILCVPQSQRIANGRNLCRQQGSGRFVHEAASRLGLGVCQPSRRSLGKRAFVCLDTEDFS